MAEDAPKNEEPLRPDVPASQDPPTSNAGAAALLDEQQNAAITALKYRERVVRQALSTSVQTKQAALNQQLVKSQEAAAAAKAAEEAAEARVAEAKTTADARVAEANTTAAARVAEAKTTAAARVASVEAKVLEAREKHTTRLREMANQHSTRNAELKEVALERFLQRVLEIAKEIDTIAKQIKEPSTEVQVLVLANGKVLDTLRAKAGPAQRMQNVLTEVLGPQRSRRPASTAHTWNTAGNQLPLVHARGGTTVQDPNFEMGAEVDANKDGNGRFYAATVSGVNADGTYDITYSDGGYKEVGVLAMNVRPRGWTAAAADSDDSDDDGEFEMGAEVDANKDGNGRFYAATVSGVNADGTYDITYSDGGYKEVGVPAMNVRPRGWTAAADSDDSDDGDGNYIHSFGRPLLF